MSGAIEDGNISGKTWATAVSTATVKAAPGRVFGIQVSYSTASCPVELKDGGSGGTSLWKQTFQLTTAGTPFADIDLHGLRFGTDIYITMSNHSRVSIQYA